LLYPGNTLSQNVLQDAVGQMERVLGIAAGQRRSICLRMDAGFGTDNNLAWTLKQGYQMIAKNNSGRRAYAWSQHIVEWHEIKAAHRWIALPKEQLRFALPTRTLAVRWLDREKKRFKHALYVTTDLHSPLAEIAHRYDLRGGFEVNIRDDKQGLLLTHRRKRQWHAQEVLVLLNDLAHNFLSAFRSRVLIGTPLEAYGPYRLIQEVLSIPGKAILQGDRLVGLGLLQSHPHAAILADVLPRLWR
jgi:hypothetical protein